MLVLTRKQHEAVKIGDDIEVIVLDVNGGRVRLGFRCPKTYRIVRAELVDFTSPLSEQELNLPVGSLASPAIHSA